MSSASLCSSYPWLVLLLCGIAAHTWGLQDEQGAQAIHRACKEGDVASLKALLDSGVDPNIIDGMGMNPMHVAVRSDQLAVLREILSRPGIRINQPDNVGYTPLLLAASSGKIHMLDALLKAGADVKKADLYGGTALMKASSAGHIDCMQRLIEAGASVNAEDKYGITALMGAAGAGRVEACRTLLAAGAQPDVVNMGIGGTALMLAVGSGNEDVVRVLLEGGADVNLVATDGTTALMAAATYGHAHLVQLLLDSGASVKEKDLEDNSAIMLACDSFNPDRKQAELSVDALIRAGAEPVFNGFCATYLKDAQRADQGDGPERKGPPASHAEL